MNKEGVMFEGVFVKGTFDPALSGMDERGVCTLVAQHSETEMKSGGDDFVVSQPVPQPGDDTDTVYKLPKIPLPATREFKFKTLVFVCHIAHSFANICIAGLNARAHALHMELFFAAKELPPLGSWLHVRHHFTRRTHYLALVRRREKHEKDVMPRNFFCAQFVFQETLFQSESRGWYEGQAEAGDGGRITSRRFR